MKKCIIYKIITRIAKEINYFPLLNKYNISEKVIQQGLIKEIKDIERRKDAYPTYFIVYAFSCIGDKTSISKTLYTYKFEKYINQTLYIILKPYIKRYLEKNLLTNKILDKLHNNCFRKKYSFDEFYEILKKENVNVLNLLRSISWHDDFLFWKEENKKFVIFILKLLINKN